MDGQLSTSKQTKSKEFYRAFFCRDRIFSTKKRGATCFPRKNRWLREKEKRRIQDLRTWRIPTMIKMAPAKEASVSGSWRKSTPENVEQTVVMVPKEE